MWWNKYMDMNVPFQEKGREITGWDCWGVPYVVYRNERGIILPDYLDCYKTTQDREILAKTIKKERENNWQSVKEPKEFDIIILKLRGLPMHVGIVTKKNHMIHCAKDINTVHESFTSMRWQNKVVGFARWIS